MTRSDQGADTGEEEMGPVEAITMAVRVGAGPSYSSGAMDIGDEDVQRVRLGPAPMPQYQIAYDSGVEDLAIPEGLEEEYPLLIDHDSVASQTRKMVRELAEQNEEGGGGESGERRDAESGAGAGTAGGGSATSEEQEAPAARQRRTRGTAAPA